MMARPTILEAIVARTRERLAAFPFDRATLERAAAEASRAPDAFASLTAPGVRIIAEVKRKSPSAGALREDADPVEVARLYADAGAAAISVLTEPEHFGGSIEDLSEVAGAVALPCLRKDFVVDEVQLLEGRAAGAAMGLLIVAVLTDRELRALREAGERLGLAMLVEAHTEDEVRRAVDSGARIVGVNNRDLHGFGIDLATSERLRRHIPAGVLAVTESGIASRADVDRLRAAGFEVFLVGSSLMTAPDPGVALRALVGSPD